MPSITPSNFRTNISSLIGRLALGRSEAAFGESVRNLTSGIKLHSGRDNPSAFLASSTLETELSSLAQAVANSQKANSALSTADGALQQVNSLLLDLRSLVTEAANTGGETPQTIAAMQLQADSVLDAINRISQSTLFTGQQLLDGSLDFETYGVDAAKIDALQINQANFFGRIEKDISVKVLETPKKASLSYPFGVAQNNVQLEIGGNLGYQTFSFDRGARADQIAAAVNAVKDSTGVTAQVHSAATSGSIALTSYGTDNDLILTASKAGSMEGNFVVKYVLPPEGNETLALNFTRSYGNEPSEIEIVLRSSSWTHAVYHYNGENDGIPNNEFNLRAKTPGSDFGDMEFTINNVAGTEAAPGIEYDLNASPKKMTINVRYDEADPSDPANTTVNELAGWIAADSTLNAYFTLENVAPSSGAGPIVPGSPITQSVPGTDGGRSVTTAEEVMNLINTSPLLRDTDGTGLVSAALPSGTQGLGFVTPFTDYTYYGETNDRTRLQFLAPEGSPRVKFVSEPGTPLSVEDTSDPPVYGYAKAEIQGLDPGTSFSLRALRSGKEYDNIKVVLKDAPDESAVYDPAAGAVVFSVDFTGRATDPARGSFTMEDLKSLLWNDPLLKDRYTIEPKSVYDPADPPAFGSASYIGIETVMATTSGGVVDPGTLTIHLETDANGLVKTTANDLVKFFDYPTSEESKKVLDQYGISVCSIDPTNMTLTSCTLGTSDLGTGVLRPSYDPVDCDLSEAVKATMYSKPVWTSDGSEVAYDYPATTVRSANGTEANFTVTAKKAGPEFNNVTVVVTSGVANAVSYDENNRVLTVHFDRNDPATANDVIDLINGTPEIASLFHANRAPGSDGSGTVAEGDTGRLTGGVVALTNVPETTVFSSGGVNAVFSISARKADAALAGTALNVVYNADGPSVAYDAATKQITIGMRPNETLTASQAVALINNSEATRSLFTASIPVSVPGSALPPDGTGFVRAGDSGTLTIAENAVPLGAPMFGNTDDAGTGITFYSLDYGSQAFVEVRGILGTEFPVVDRYGNTVERSEGTDVSALIDNVLAVGNGNIASTRTTELDLSIWIAESVRAGEVFGFRITGGGALFQLGPDVDPTQQSRISLPNIHTSHLGGPFGKLSDIRDGGMFDLATNTNEAFRIVEETITQISSLRGRIGAFQRNQVDANIDTMLEAVENATSANSVLKDTDYAEESSRLAREQLMMQSTLAILPKATDNARAILALLQR